MADVGYGDARAVESAVKSAAQAAHEANPVRQTGDLIRQAYYDRFLCRIFSEADASEWVLKGGTGMLARVPTARRTVDADLFRAGYSPEHALSDLRRLAAVDLGDHFRFVYRDHSEILIDALQPYTDGYRVTFDAYLGVKLVDTIRIDLSTGSSPTGTIEVEDPANRLTLPRLESYPYRLYPIVDQVADKVSATITDYNGRPSSREKDLVDLVVIALTQTMDAVALRTAIESECAKRRLIMPERFEIPEHWGRVYARLARSTPAEPHSITAARDLVGAFIDPVLNKAAGGVWHPKDQAWA